MKAILVIDVPNDYDFETAIALVDVANEKGESVVAMRPLKPMPKRREIQTDIEELIWDKDSETIYALGFNRCVGELEK